jgi:MFS family permease
MAGSHAVTDIPSVERPGITASLQSRIGLNAANFFLAEVTGVVLPFLNDFLRERGWRYDSIGIATATAGLGVFLMQSPAGFLVDRIPHRRTMLAAASLLLGVCYGFLPLVPTDWWIVDPLLFLAGAGQAFFTPLLGALALALVGHAQLNKTMGMNQGFNHLGNMAAAISAMVLVIWIGLAGVFYAVAAVAALAAASVFVIRPQELDEKRASGATQDDGSESIGFWALLQDRRVVVLFAATALFHLANAPVMPLVALYLKHLKGSDMQVAAVVLVAQLVMVPVALVTGWLCDRWGRKPVFAIGFVVLPVRIFLYSLAESPGMLIALQTLDGIGAGIYGVAIVAMCADLTKGKGGFNTLCGMIATALCLGSVIGPLSSGFLVEHLGFVVAFNCFAGAAALAAALFLFFMPETRPSNI